MSYGVARQWFLAVLHLHAALVLVGMATVHLLAVHNHVDNARRWLR